MLCVENVACRRTKALFPDSIGIGNRISERETDLYNEGSDA
jgi:hypothetical protein